MIKLHDFDVYGFSKIPFKQSPNIPFMDEERKNSLNSLKNFLNYRGFAVLSGSPGTGKTILLRYFCNQLQPNENKIIYIPFTGLKATGILQHICQKIGLEPSRTKSIMISSIQEEITQMFPVNPILILDEIQKISHEALETIRLLTNINFDDKNYFSVIMAGTDDFIYQLRLRINEALLQRITLYSHLNPLSREETERYINYHIKDAGVQSELFSQEVIYHIYNITSGIPRLISSLTFAAIEIAAREKSKIITLEHINEAEKMVMPPKMENFK